MKIVFFPQEKDNAQTTAHGAQGLFPNKRFCFKGKETGPFSKGSVLL